MEGNMPNMGSSMQQMMGSSMPQMMGSMDQNMQNNMMKNMNEKLNFENMNLIEFICLPIVINKHFHPLILCNTLERKKYGTSWKCNNCFNNFTYEEPSFYCTFCDYDICKKCIENLKINEIKFNDFCKNKTNIHFPSNGNFAWTKKYVNHEHLVTFIKRKNEKFSWFCNICYKNYSNSKPSFYCSLCDYDVCSDCYCKDKSPMETVLMNSLNNPMNPMINPMNPMINPMFPMINPMNPNFQFDNWFYHSQLSNKKPVIYLYPEKPMEIAIQLNVKNSKIEVIYPKFNEINNTWKVKAEPNGDIIINNKIYPYLFYELVSYVPQLQNEGFIVKDEDAENFLENKLKILGLNSKESTDFITYWLPLLLKNKISLCTFQKESFFNNFELNINPKPDTLIRIFLSIKKIDSIPDIKEQKLQKIERKGFTVIEWGGSNLKD